MSDTPTSSLLATLSDDLANAVEQGGAATVTVNARRRMPASGILWTADGSIVTANHVVERDEEITITLPDGRTVEAKLTGRDPNSDIALLRVDATDLAPVTRATEPVKPGNLVLAIGRPGPSGPMASFGMVSMIGGPLRAGNGRGGHRGGPPQGGPGRRGGPQGGPEGFGRRGGPPPPPRPEGFPGVGSGIERFIRADVAMLPGFSGGPLITASGEIAGMNSSFLGRWGGLTLPVDVIDPIVTALQTHGKVRRGFLGIGVQAVRVPQAHAESAGSSQEQGLLIVNIEPEGPAEKGGLFLGDIILSIADSAVTTVEELQERLSGAMVGNDAAISIIRGGSAMTVSVKVGERP
jgi:S1-C subfamily serine protease